MKWIKEHWLVLALLLLPFIILAVLWSDLPEEIPVHWNLKGEIDRYGSKFELLLLPVLNVFVYFLIVYLPRLDPKKNVTQFAGTLNKIALATVAFMFLVFVLVLLTTLGYTVNVVSMIFTATILLFLILGNYMSKFRPNYFVGIRTPWTLENEDVWVKTHRFAGALWVSASVGMLVYMLFDRPFDEPHSVSFLILFMAYAMACAIIPLIYSYIIYRRLKS